MCTRTCKVNVHYIWVYRSFTSYVPSHLSMTVKKKTNGITKPVRHQSILCTCSNTRDQINFNKNLKWFAVLHNQVAHIMFYLCPISSVSDRILWQEFTNLLFFRELLSKEGCCWTTHQAYLFLRMWTFAYLHKEIKQWEIFLQIFCKPVWYLRRWHTLNDSYIVFFHYIHSQFLCWRRTFPESHK